MYLLAWNCISTRSACDIVYTRLTLVIGGFSLLLKHKSCFAFCKPAFCAYETHVLLFLCLSCFWKTNSYFSVAFCAYETHVLYEYLSKHPRVSPFALYSNLLTSTIVVFNFVNIFTKQSHCFKDFLFISKMSFLVTSHMVGSYSQSKVML